MEYNPVFAALGLAPSTNFHVRSQYVFQKQGPLQRWVILKKWSTFCIFGQVAFAAAKCKGIPEDIVKSIFCGAKN